ncbi:Uncharacterised protein [Ectopseudomonas mendocina]|uniref:Uncharacterized protein n=1 Tax=Ectopseudomonas mendocina TaxID=300 RepID=A0A379PPD6_ECTME|nr:hypothetical protein [Pseudomonas mendocina]SUE95863.1 Uncharacterised protein [Pseudomonas mendocina]
MPDFELILDELEKFMASDDPIKLSFLEGYKRGKRAARIQILIVTLGLAALFMGYQVAQAADSVDQGYESTQIDEDGPDQDPVYDEDDPVYDEMDDYDHE